MQKSARRKASFALIRSLSPTEKASFSHAICNRIAATVAFQNAQTVFSYLALPGEPNLNRLVHEHPAKRWAFPRVNEDDRLAFYSGIEESDRITGSHGILEPLGHPDRLVSPAEANLILVPGVSFDRLNGTRLGRGKGHYDRYLAQCLASQAKILIFGICFSIQCSDLTPEEHDIPMDQIFTELDSGAGSPSSSANVS